jgi:hypothetical protein
MIVSVVIESRPNLTESKGIEDELRWSDGSEIDQLFTIGSAEACWSEVTGVVNVLPNSASSILASTDGRRLC